MSSSYNNWYLDRQEDKLKKLRRNYRNEAQSVSNCINHTEVIAKCYYLSKYRTKIRELEDSIAVTRRLINLEN